MGEREGRRLGKEESARGPAQGAGGAVPIGSGRDGPTHLPYMEGGWGWPTNIKLDVRVEQWAVVIQEKVE